MTSKKLSEQDIEEIIQRAHYESDRKLANEYGVSAPLIVRIRKEHGIIKSKNKDNQGGSTPVKKRAKKVIDQNALTRTPSSALNEKQRAEFFKNELQNSLSYEVLQKQFTRPEIDYFLEEWGSMCVQFQDVLATEKRQISELIKQEIIGNRILVQIRIAEERIESLIKEIEILEKLKEDAKGDEERQDVLAEWIDRCGSLLSTMYNSVKGMTKEYGETLDNKSGILQDLNAKRKDREDIIKKGGETFQGLIKKYRDDAIRSKEGRELELIRLAKEKKKDKYRHPTRFPDGSMDCVLLDKDSHIQSPDYRASEKEEDEPQEQTEIEKTPEEIERERLIKSRESQRVVLVENDITRVQFFQDWLEGFDLRISTTVNSARSRLSGKHTIDYIFLEYDLKLEKSSEAMRWLAEQGKLDVKRIIIHSENPEGVKELQEILKDYDVFTITFSELYEKHKAGKKLEEVIADAENSRPRSED